MQWLRVHYARDSVVEGQAAAHTEDAHSGDQRRHVAHVRVAVWMVRICHLHHFCRLSKIIRIRRLFLGFNVREGTLVYDSLNINK